MENRLDPVLRALPCALRGVSTDILPFNNLGHLVFSENLAPSTATALVSLAEPCVLFRALDSLLKRVAPKTLMLQALYSAIRESLRSYLAIISELEMKVRPEVKQLNLALSSLQILLQSPTLLLRLFLNVLRQCLEPNANILSILYEYTQHGDPLIQRYAEGLYSQCNEPFQSLLKEWENLGSLHLDVYHEFFVEEKGNAFELVEDRVPSPMTMAEAQECIDRGRAVNFIRFVCGDAAFDGEKWSFAEIMEYTHQQLFHNYDLLSHFKGLKDYMLLANGNFVDALFRNDSSNFLMQPVSNVGSYMASEFFVSAIDDLGASGLENEAIMKCVDAYILGIDNPTVSAKKQWRVWEAFIGKYHLDAKPLQVIVDSEATSLYERCFASLWRIRLAVYSLTESSARLRLLSRYEDVSRLVEVHSVLNAGMLLAQQFLYYRVIDQEWMHFQRKVSEQTTLTLTQIKHTHDAFLSHVAAAAASPPRAKAIQSLVRVVLGFQRILEDAENNQPSPTETDLVQLVNTFEELIESLHYD